MTRADLIGIAPWALAVTLGAGTMVAMATRSGADVGALAADVRAHAETPAHHESARRISLAEARLQALEEQRRELTAELRSLTAATTAIQRRVERLCSVTPGCRVE